MKIVDRREPRSEYLAAFLEVAEIRHAVVLAGVALAGGVGRARIVGVTCMAELDDAVQRLSAANAELRALTAKLREWEPDWSAS